MDTTDQVVRPFLLHAQSSSSASKRTILIKVANPRLADSIAMAISRSSAFSRADNAPLGLETVIADAATGAPRHDIVITDQPEGVFEVPTVVVGVTNGTQAEALRLAGAAQVISRVWSFPVLLEALASTLDVKIKRIAPTLAWSSAGFDVASA